MFILFLTVTLLVILFLFINKSHVIAVNKSQVKYPLKEPDKQHFDKYGVKQDHLPANGLFYTTTPWNESNYFKYNNRYYLIEPGYYYNITPEAEFYANRINCICLNLNSQNLNSQNLNSQK
jgi:hypothetical protein